MGIYENDIFKAGKIKTDRIIEILSKYDVCTEDVNKITKAFVDVYYNLYESNVSAKVLEKIAKETSGLSPDELCSIYTKFMAKEMGYTLDKEKTSESLKQEKTKNIDVTEDDYSVMQEKTLNSDLFSIEEGSVDIADDIVKEEPKTLSADIKNNESFADEDPENYPDYGCIENQYLRESKRESRDDTEDSSVSCFLSLEDQYLNEEEPQKQEIKRADRLSPQKSNIFMGFRQKKKDTLPVVGGEVIL